MALGSKIDKTNPNFNFNKTGSASNVMKTTAEIAQVIGAIMAA